MIRLRDMAAHARPQRALSALPPLGARFALHDSAHALFARTIRETPPQLDRAALMSAYDSWLEGTMSTKVRNGVAIIPIRGVLFKEWNWYSYYMGCSTYDEIAYDLDIALASPQVSAIILQVDSPGGMVDGVEELAAKIYAARAGEKPIYAHVDGYGASAAYWLTSAAARVFAQSTAGLGSLGAMMSFVDYSGAYKEFGIEIIDIISTQSPKKNADPATPEGRSLYQTQVDDIADVFIDRVALNRGTDRETVLAQFGQGDVFVGQRAVEAGLADELRTLDALHQEIVAEHATVTLPVSQYAALRAANQTPQTTPASVGGHNMAKTAKAAPPTNASAEAATDDEKKDEETSASAEEQQDEEKKDEETTVARKKEPTVAEIRAEAAAAERKRIAAIRDLGTPGTEAIVAKCIDDPDCSVEKAALAILQASKQGKQQHLKAIAADEQSFKAPDNQDGGDVAASTDDKVIARIAGTYLEHRRPGQAKLANRSNA